MLKDYFNLAVKNTKMRGLRSWLTIIGVFIGIAAVVSLISLGEGLRLAVSSQFDFLSPDILTIQGSGLAYGPLGSGVVTPLKEEYVKGIEKLAGVEAGIGRIIEDATVKFGSKTHFTYVGSVPSGKKREIIERVIGLEALNGRLLRDQDLNKIVVGNHFADKEHLGKALQPGSKVQMQGKEFEVVGILEKKGNIIIDNTIMLNERVMKDLFEIEEAYDLIVVKVVEGAEVKAVKENVERYLRKERDVEKGAEDFVVESPEQTIKSLEATLFAIQIFIYIIAGISIVVGGVGISNTMYTSVVERTKHIGIMKSVGAKNRNIFSLFLFESGLLGLVGGLLGVVVGVLLANGLAFIGNNALSEGLINVSVTPALIIWSLIFSFVVGSVAGLLPAIQASKLRPVESLRFTK